MTERFHYITVKLQPDDDSEVPASFPFTSFFFQSGFRLNTSRVVGQLSEDTSKDDNLGHLWHDVDADEGKFTFEIATELPYYFPNLAGKPEYTLSLGDVSCFVCNRMVRAFWGKGFPKADGEQYVLVHRRGLLSLPPDLTKEGLHPLPMRTFMGCQFVVEAQTAEEAVEQHFIEWRSVLLTHIRAAADAFRFVAPEKARYLFPYPAIASYPVFWVSVVGRDGKRGCEQFAGDLRVVANRALEDLDSAKAAELLKSLKGSEKPHAYESGIGLALAFSHYGHYDQAVAQVCTALETLLAETLRLNLEKKGLSKAQVKRALDDITLSQLLNLHLFVFCDLTKLPKYQDLLGQAKWLRKRRNEIVHQGYPTERLTKENVPSAIGAIQEMMRFVVEEAMVCPGTIG